MVLHHRSCHGVGVGVGVGGNVVGGNVVGGNVVGDVNANGVCKC